MSDSYNDLSSPPTRQALILSRSAAPLHFVKSPKFNYQTNSFSHRCSDHMEIGLDIKNNKITAAGFNGEGCAIFLAATDLMLGEVANRTPSDGLKIVNNYLNFMHNAPHEAALLGKLAALQNVKLHPNRITCATQVAEALNELLASFTT